MPALFAAAIIVFLEGLSFGVILPVLSEFTQRLGGTVTTAGILFALSTGPRIIFAPLWGRLSEHWGRRWSLALVSAGTLSGSVLWALSVELGAVVFSGLTWLVISRAVYGIFAAQSVLGLAIASDVSSPQRRAAAMGVLGAAFGLAFTCGPWLGGAFAERFGPEAIGWLAAAAQLISLGVILTLLRETHPNRSAATGPDEAVFIRPSSMLRITATPAIVSLLIVTLLSTVAYSVMFPTFQPLSGEWYGWDLARAGLALSVFGLIGALVQGGLIRPAVKRLGERGTGALGLVVLGAGLLWVSIRPGEAGFWVGLGLMAIGTGFSVPAILGMMSLSVGEQDQGAIHGLNQSATSLGRVGGYLLGGWAYVAMGPASAYVLAGCVALAALVLLVAARRRARAPQAYATNACG